MAQQEVIVVPRNFRLLGELEKAEKAQGDDQFVSYGLVRDDDIGLSDFRGTIMMFHPAYQGPLENRIINLTVHCTANYPGEAPVVRFQNKLDFPFLVCAAPSCGSSSARPAHFPPRGSASHALHSASVTFRSP